jgi:redox-sensing transcriptional repressor
MKATGREMVSCTHLAEALSLDPTQIRKDLATTGIVGKPRVGYVIADLQAAIAATLGWDNLTDGFLVGAGSLGRAILGYDDFAGYGLNLVAAFDVDSARVGAIIRGIEVLPIEKLPDLAARMHVKIGVLTVPAPAARDTANLMVLSGIEAIWNFAPVTLDVPDGIIVEDVHLSTSLAMLSTRLREKNARN